LLSTPSPCWEFPALREVFLETFEQVRGKYRFDMIGFVVMPEHIHLLIGEPKQNTVPMVMQILKQRVARRLLPPRDPGVQRELWRRPERQRLWQRRYYDFNVYSDEKVTEKLVYMHRNPVERGLVSLPELWLWSSYRTFAGLDKGL
jgi:putative transposase